MALARNEGYDEFHIKDSCLVLVLEIVFNKNTVFCAQYSHQILSKKMHEKNKKYHIEMTGGETLMLNI